MTEWPPVVEIKSGSFFAETGRNREVTSAAAGQRETMVIGTRDAGEREIGGHMVCRTRRRPARFIDRGSDSVVTASSPRRSAGLIHRGSVRSTDQPHDGPRAGRRSVAVRSVYWSHKNARMRAATESTWNATWRKYVVRAWITHR